MKAIVQDRYGDAAVWRLDTVDTPEVGADEVLVQAHAAGLDRGTWHLMTGEPRLLRLGYGLRGPKKPVPGIDVAGTVTAVGTNVSRFSIGDEVFGIAKGSFAEFAVALEKKLSPKPANLTFAQAAVVPVSGLTAIQAVRDCGRVQPGQKVLITGASGGVGTYAVQLAKAFGAEVTGVCSTAKVDLVRSLGATHVLDYTRDDFATGPERYDVILDIGGNATLSRLRRALTPKGTLVVVGGENGGTWTGGFGRLFRAAALSPFVSQRLMMIIAKEHHDDLDALTPYLESGAVVPAVDRTYALADAADAVAHLAAGLVRGKVAIAVIDDASSGRGSVRRAGGAAAR